MCSVAYITQNTYRLEADWNVTRAVCENQRLCSQLTLFYKLHLIIYLQNPFSQLKREQINLYLQKNIQNSAFTKPPLMDIPLALDCTRSKWENFCGTFALASMWSYYLPLHTIRSHNRMPPTWKHPVTSSLSCRTCTMPNHCWLMHPECALFSYNQI